MDFYIDITDMTFPIHIGDIKVMFPEWSIGMELPEGIQELDISNMPELVEDKTVLISGAELVDGKWMATFTSYDI